MVICSRSASVQSVVLRYSSHWSNDKSNCLVFSVLGEDGSDVAPLPDDVDDVD